jgi:pyrimidine operon attenuation protein/uracil phosphoribosyltransferase
MLKFENLIFDERKIQYCTKRIAYQIFESNIKSKEIFLVGIADNGSVFAKEIENILNEITQIKITTLKLKIHKNKPENKISLDFKIEVLKNKNVVIVDDVLNTGFVLAHALKFLLTVNINQIKIAVLVNREHNKFPVKADFKGISLSTSLNETVKVNLDGKKRGIYLI